jgi:hypothetical protein
MPSSEMLRHVALVRTDALKERSVSIIKVTRIGELGTTLAVTSNRRTLRRNSILYYTILYYTILYYTILYYTILYYTILYHYTNIVFLRSVRRLLVTANVVPIKPILVTLIMEVLRSPKRRLLQEPHSTTSQKTAFFIVTAVKTSNLR